MPNIANVLKEEIRRLARKEVKAQSGKTRQAVAQYRHEIAKLKRQLGVQEKLIARLAAQRVHGQDAPAEAMEENLRFSARSVKAQRRKTGLSAADYGKLAGVSGLTIYNWELGKARPRQAQFEALVALRGLGKREARARLEAMEAEQKKGQK